MYREFAKDVLANDVYGGRNQNQRNFAGAVNTYGVEALMQDVKSLQLGTSHDLRTEFL
jgi:prolyl-tRNA synthetase